MYFICVKLALPYQLIQRYRIHKYIVLTSNDRPLFYSNKSISGVWLYIIWYCPISFQRIQRHLYIYIICTGNHVILQDKRMVDTLKTYNVQQVFRKLSGKIIYEIIYPRMWCNWHEQTYFLKKFSIKNRVKKGNLCYINKYSDWQTVFIDEYNLLRHDVVVQNL